MRGAIVSAVLLRTFCPPRGRAPGFRVRGRSPRSGGVGEADGAPRPALERAMHRAGIPYEVRAGPRASGEELVRECVALEPIAAPAGRDDVAGGVGPSPGEGVDVIERGFFQCQLPRTVHAPSTAIAEGGLLQGPLRVATERRMLACVRGTAATGRARSNHPENPTSRHCPSPEKTTPRPGLAGAGCREWSGGDAACRDRYRGTESSRSS